MTIIVIDSKDVRSIVNCNKYIAKNQHSYFNNARFLFESIGTSLKFLLWLRN